MENKGNFYAGLCVMIGLAIMGFMLPRAARVFRSYERSVSVKGLCEREVKADKVIWPLVIKSSGNDIAALHAELNAKNEVIKAFLKEGGIQDDEITISMSSSDKNTSEYGNTRDFRFILKSVITVCTNNVDSVVALMEKQNNLFEKGVVLSTDEWGTSPDFSFEGLNDIKPEMIEEATRNARASAQKFAEDSGSKLGKIKNASQGTFSISDRDSNTPNIKEVRVVTYVEYYLSN